MATAREKLINAKRVYITSCDKQALLEQAEILVSTLKPGILNQDNAEIAEALLIKIQLKVLAYAYFCDGYEASACDKILKYTQKYTPYAQKKGYTSTARLCQDVSACAEGINSVMSGAFIVKAQVCDENEVCVITTADEGEKLSAALGDMIDRINALQINPKPFGEDVQFDNVKKMAVRDLSQLKGIADSAIARLKFASIEKLFLECTEDITHVKSYTRPYYPQNDSVERAAGALIVCSPIQQEVELFVSQYATGSKLYALHALALDGKTEEEADAIFSVMAKEQGDCVVYGASRFRGEVYPLLRAAMKFGKFGRRVFIWDTEPNRPLYSKALSCTGDGLTNLDISFVYLGMPDFQQVISILEEGGMLAETGVDNETVKQRLPFMGFSGLNEGVCAFIANTDKTSSRWLEVAADFSERNRADAVEFLKDLCNQALFLDSGWGTYYQSKEVAGRNPFDYDDIKESNPNNIRKIMQGEFSLFQKCGLLARYCTLHGQDVSIWTDMDKDERSARLTEATRLVMRALDVDIQPVVEVRDKLDPPDAGGLCCDGGKQILYRTDCTNNYDWMVRAICHECFHAFQHKAETEPYRTWFWKELGVTRGRIDKWAYNSKYYKDIPKGNKAGNPYMTQIVESDARAFEDDCFADSEDVINSINFE